MLSIRIPRTAICTLVAALTTAPAWGWGDVGHQTVARIAARQLTKNARAKVAQILGVDDTSAAVADAMAEASVWADHVARDNYSQSSPWHYLDMSLLNGDKDKPDPFSLENTAYSKIVQYAGTLKAGAPDELEHGSDLKLLIHFVGDIHQPLHAATDQDRGGNCLFVQREISATEKAPSEKLHRAWDTSMLEENVGGNSKAVASHLLRHYRQLSAKEKAAALGSTPADTRALARGWMMQSHDLAVTNAYKPLNPPVPLLPQADHEIDGQCNGAPAVFKGTTWILSAAYQEQASDRIEKQLLSGGLRLAHLLNSIWQ